MNNCCLPINNTFLKDVPFFLAFKRAIALLCIKPIEFNNLRLKVLYSFINELFVLTQKVTSPYVSFLRQQKMVLQFVRLTRAYVLQ